MSPIHTPLMGSLDPYTTAQQKVVVAHNFTQFCKIGCICWTLELEMAMSMDPIQMQPTCLLG